MTIAAVAGACRREFPRMSEPRPAASPAPAALWSLVERQAVEMAAREPVLRRLLADTVLCHDTPASVVGTALWRRLAASGDRDVALRALLVETLLEDASLLDCIAADLAAVSARDPACRSALHALLHFKGFHALQTHRIAHRLWTSGRADVALWLSGEASATLGVDIHPAVPVGRRVMLDHATGIVVGETAVIEDDVTVLHGVTLGATGKSTGDRHPKVRAGAVLGAGATVLGNIEVGRMSRIGAGSVVLHARPSRAPGAGGPARVVRADGRVPGRPVSREVRGIVVDPGRSGE